MGKNRAIESLVRLIVNTVVHEIVAKHTNKPESFHFLQTEIIEYRDQTEKAAKEYNWNNEDKEYINKTALKKIKERLAIKYSDVKYSEQEIKEKLKKMIEKIMYI